MVMHNEVIRIRKEAQAICDPYKIQVTRIDLLPEAAGGGFAVNISLPSGLKPDAPEIAKVRLRLEAIKGVQRVFVVLASRQP